MKYSISIFKVDNSSKIKTLLKADIANGSSPSFDLTEYKQETSGNTTSWVISSSSKNDYSCGLGNYDILIDDFYVKKQIYAPNSVKLKLSVKIELGKGIIEARKDLRSFFIGSFLSVNQIFTDSQNSDVVFEVVKDYPVFDLKCNSDMSQITMELIAYSPDRYAALNKHSEAFTGKTIDEILNKAIKEPFGISYDISNTLYLHYMMKKDKSAEKEERQYHRIPYAVQYNESTYDFISRLAKRHGEFLFFEDEQLHVGCLQNFDDIDNAAINIKNENILNFQFEDSVPNFLSAYVGTNHLSEPREGGEDLSDCKGQYKVFIPTKSDKAYNIVNTEYANNDSYVDIKKGMTVFTNKEEEDAFLKCPDNFKLEDGDLLAMQGKDFFIGGSLNAVPDILNQSSTVLMILKAAMNLKELTYGAYKDTKRVNTFYLDNIKEKDSKTNELLKATRYNDGPYGQSKLESKLESKLKSKLESESESKLDLADHFVFVSYVSECAMKAYDGRIVFQLDIPFFNNKLKLGSLITFEGNNKMYYIVTAIDIKRGETDCNESLSKKLPGIFVEAIPYVSDDNKTGETIPYFNPSDLKREASPQVAIVVDNKDPYRLNRVRVCYPWQFVNKGAANAEKGKDFREWSREVLRNNATPWIRVATPAAVGGGGFLFTPELYSEVLVNYENGNIEKPYVESSVFRMGDNLFEPSANKERTNSISSRFGQKIIFHDGNRGEKFLAKIATPILDLGFDFFCSKGLKGNEKIGALDGFTEITDNYGLNSVKLSTTDREISIKSSWGKVSINALTGIKIEAPNGDISIKGKNVSISAGNKLSIVSGTNIDRPSQVSSVKVSVLSALNEKIVIDLSLLRVVTEAIFKPVGGEMVIKSNRSLSLEAGRGNAHVSSYMKRNPLNPKNVSNLQVVQIKKQLLDFFAILKNCRAALDLVKQKKEIYRGLFESSVDGWAKIKEDLKTNLKEGKHAHIESEFAKIIKPDEVKVDYSNTEFQPVEVDLDINDDDVLNREGVNSLKEKTNNLLSKLNEYMNSQFEVKDKLAKEINLLDQPMQWFITRKLFNNEILPLKTDSANTKSKYALVRQAIEGELAAKRVLLLCIIQLMQAVDTHRLFNLNSTVIILDLPGPIQEIVDRFVEKKKILSSIQSVFSQDNFSFICEVKLKDAKALEQDEISKINASWRFIVNNIFSDEAKTWDEMCPNIFGLDGFVDNNKIFAKKKNLDRSTLDDGHILFSDDRHITYRFDSRMKEFVTSDTSYDNEILGKLKEVLNSLEEDSLN